MKKVYIITLIIVAVLGLTVFVLYRKGRVMECAEEAQKAAALRRHQRRVLDTNDEAKLYDLDFKQCMQKHGVLYP